MDVQTGQHPLRVGRGRQVAYGVGLLVAGGVLAVLLVRAGADVLAGACAVSGVWGLALVVHGTLMNRRVLPTRPGDDAARRRGA